jgi:hypothetical protein
MNADFESVEMPLPPEAPRRTRTSTGSAGSSRPRQRAVPQPGGVLREGAELTNDARRDVERRHLHGVPSEKLKAYAEEHNPAWLAGLAELRDVTWVDLPTSHWPMVAPQSSPTSSMTSPRLTPPRSNLGQASSPGRWRCGGQPRVLDLVDITGMPRSISQSSNAPGQWPSISSWADA